jgi:immune inhibitor A
MQRKYGFAKEMQGQSLQPIVIDKILVLGVEFSDKPAQIPIDTIYQRFFGDYINSMKEYYKEVSYSRYVPHGEIHGWYRAPNPSTYYTDKQNGFGKYPNSAERLVEDVVEIASNDPNIDWASFDNNNNGYIDNLIVVHSGAEAAWTGDINDFWAHVWIIPEPKIIQGRYVWIYAMTSEYLGKPEDPQVIGGDCHEHGHQLGLPDLYDTSYVTNGVGAYSLMGAGSWGNMGMTPTHLDAWSKYVLGFTDPIIDTIGTAYIDNAETSPTIFKYMTEDPKQYFLVENRQKVLYDKYLPSEGLFIWRINENQIDNQTYNNNKNDYLVGLIQADNLKDLENRANNGDLGDPYPGIMNNRSFGKFTNPSSILHNGGMLDILIGNISDPRNTMSFESSIPGPSPTQVARAGFILHKQ